MYCISLALLTQSYSAILTLKNQWLSKIELAMPDYPNPCKQPVFCLDNGNEEIVY
jgi:hypothetical protein